MTRMAPRVVAAAALAARVVALIGVCGGIAIAGFVAGCDRVVNLTPFYDAGELDGRALFDGGIAFPEDGAFLEDGAPPDDGNPFPYDGNPFPDDSNPFPYDGNSDGALAR